MRGFNFNISSLFGNMGAGSAFGSFNFGDYASIKNGSYGKLMKSYYAEQKKSIASDKEDRTDKTSAAKAKEKKELTTMNTGLSQLKRESDGLKAAAEALGKEELWKQTDGQYDIDKIVSAVKTYASTYNDTLTQSEKVSSKDIAQDVKYMTGMTSAISKALTKIGIAVGTDGKLSVNEDELKKANVTSIKSLFVGPVSYGSQISDRAHDISRDAITNSSVYGSNGALSSSFSNMFNKWI